MTPLTWSEFGLTAAALAGTLVLTPVVAALARRYGAVARPRADRWHQKPTALLGGIAIFTTILVVYLVGLPHTPQTHVVMAVSTLLFFVGLVDDFRRLKPYQKLIGQLMGAVLLVAGGLHLPWTPSPLLNMAITIVWLVGITNALNLLDNMDGLAAGVAAIAAGFLAYNCWVHDQATEGLLLAVFVAALLGFLVYNSNPASVFMGDCGSLFIGCFLASTCILNSPGGRSRTLLPVLAVPVLVLFVPIFDITLVTILRKLAGRAASQGGRDHTSHRLVALGLSERRAVWLLYGLALLAGGLGLALQEYELDVSLALALGFVIALTLLGVYLAGVKVYDEEEMRAAQEKPLVAFLVNLSHKRRLFEVLLDLVLIGLAYFSASVLVLGPLDDPGRWDLFLKSLPVLLFIKPAAFLVMGVYRGLWRYVSIDNLVLYGRAVLASSVAVVLAMLLLYRFEGYSRAVFALDAVILFMLLAGSRLAFRLLRWLLPRPGSGSGRRVLIYGAGDRGELLLRWLQNRPEFHLEPVGFLDDDPLKRGKIIHGVRVVGGNGAFQMLCRQYQVEEVLISSNKFTDQRIREILNQCADLRVTLRRMQIQLEPITADVV